MQTVAAQTSTVARVGATRAAPQRGCRTVRVCCAQQQGESAPSGMKMLAAGLAAAALVSTAGPASAGVIMYKTTGVQNFTKEAPKAEKAAPGAPKAAAAKKAEYYASSGGFDFTPLALPAAVAAIVGGAAVISKVDPEFLELLGGDWSAKNSNYGAAGAGYEVSLKDTPFYGGSGEISSKATPAAAKKPSTKAGTKKVGTVKKMVAKAGTKSGSVLGSIFGSRD